MVHGDYLHRHLAAKVLDAALGEGGGDEWRPDGARGDGIDANLLLMELVVCVCLLCGGEKHPNLGLGPRCLLREHIVVDAVPTCKERERVKATMAPLVEE